MAQLRKLARSDWREYFDRVSKALPGKLAEVEVAALDVGDQILAEWIPMLGITYDSNDDLLDVAFDRGSHAIRRPREIVLEEDDAGLRSVAVIDQDGARQLVRLKQPLMLPPANAPTAAR